MPVGDSRTVHQLPIWQDYPHLFIFKPLESYHTINGTYLLHKDKTDLLYLYDFDSGKITSTYPLAKSIGAIHDYVIHHDTFYAIQSPGVIIQPLNNVGGYKFYHFKKENIGMGNYITYEQDGLHINVMKTEINSINKLRSFFKQSIDARVKLIGDSILIENISMNYPDDYAEILNYKLILINKTATPDYAVYSFRQTSQLYCNYYASGKTLVATLNSNYYTKSPELDTARLFDQTYIESTPASYFSGIVYNPYRKELYRSNYHNPEKINKKPFSTRWSLIVADEKPEVKYELVFEGSRYFSHRIIPTRKGFAVPVLPEDLEEKSQLILHEYELE